VQDAIFWQKQANVFVMRCNVSKFTEAELEYLKTQRLGRLATVNKRGEPQIAPVGFRYNAELDTIDIGGHNIATSQKFRNIARNGLAALVIDDVQPPFKPRCIEIRGKAEVLSDGGQSMGPGYSPEFIRLTPKRIIFADAATGLPQSARNVE
jgi:pyridoxamine 5'-phosphate oxidase family protein